MHYYLVGRVGIDFQFLAESAHRGKRVAGPQLPRDDGLLGSVNDLLVKRDPRPKAHAKRNHVCTMTDRTAKVKTPMGPGGRYPFHVQSSRLVEPAWCPNLRPGPKSRCSPINR